MAVQDLTATGVPGFATTTVANIELTNGTYNAQDASGVGIIFCDTNAGNIVFNGLANGVTGQRLIICKKNQTNTVTINHLNGAGTQKFITSSGAALATGTVYGSISLVCLGSNWLTVEGFS